MKLLYAIALIGLVALAKADIMENMKVLYKECQQETKATDSDLNKFFKNGMKPEDANDAVKCHIKCMLEKRGLMKNGALDEKTVVEGSKLLPFLKDRIPEITKAAAACKDIKGDNDCETAFKVAMCFKENKEALGVSKFLSANQE